MKRLHTINIAEKCKSVSHFEWTVVSYLFACFFGFYGISIIVVYLMPNKVLYK